MSKERIISAIKEIKTILGEDSNKAIMDNLDSILTYINEDCLDKNDYIAIKVWNEEDIRTCLVKKGFIDCEENVAKVIASDHISLLEDILDEEWNIIYNAISMVSDELLA